MAFTQGTVRCVLVLDTDITFVTIQVNPTTKESLTLWGADDHPVHTRVIHSNWVSLLRQAMVSNLPVTLVHPDDSALVSSVQVGPS